MIRPSRRTLLTGLGAGLLSGCSNPSLLAFGGEEEQPIGGIGGTGIVGTLVDFGSLIINGLKVETDGDTSITDAFGTIAESDLAVGDSLTLEAAKIDGVLTARRVHVTHPVIGPVTEISSDGRRMIVAGVSVELERSVEVSVKPGSRIAVSGIWNDDLVVASGISERPQPAVSVLAGAVKPHGESGEISIGGVRLQLKPGLESPPLDSFITARGIPSPGRFDVISYDLGRFTGAAGPIVRLSIDGFLTPTDAAPFQEISGLGHSFDEQAMLDPFTDSRWLFDGPYVGTFKVATGTALPESLSDRRRMLTDMLEGTSGVDPIPAR